MPPKGRKLPAPGKAHLSGKHKPSLPHSSIGAAIRHGVLGAAPIDYVANPQLPVYSPDAPPSPWDQNLFAIQAARSRPTEPTETHPVRYYPATLAALRGVPDNDYKRLARETHYYNSMRSSDEAHYGLLPLRPGHVRRFAPITHDRAAVGATTVSNPREYIPPGHPIRNDPTMVNAHFPRALDYDPIDFEPTGALDVEVTPGTPGTRAFYRVPEGDQYNDITGGGAAPYLALALPPRTVPAGDPISSLSQWLNRAHVAGDETGRFVIHSNNAPYDDRPARKRSRSAPAGAAGKYRRLGWGPWWSIPVPKW